MAPRKRKSRSVPDAVAESVKRERDRRQWTQEQLAGEMRDLGFTSWGRTTVTEVEGAGRGRQVSVPELLGLAMIFGVGIDGLLWPDGETVPLEITPDRALTERAQLIAVMVSLGAVRQLVTEGPARQFQEAVERLTAGYIDRVKETATELRGVADFIESRAFETLRKDIELGLEGGAKS